MNNKNNAVIAGLDSLAVFLRVHSSLPAANCVKIGIYPQTKEELQECLKALKYHATLNKLEAPFIVENVDNNRSVRLSKSFSGVELFIYFRKEILGGCEPVEIAGARLLKWPIPEEILQAANPEDRSSLSLAL